MTMAQVITTRDSTYNNGLYNEDYSCKGQFERIQKGPLVTTEKELTTGKSGKGRVFCAYHLVRNIPASILGTVRNICYVAEKFFDFVKSILHFDKNEIKRSGKEFCGGIGALVLRQLTFLTDSGRLFAGMLHPKAAIRFDDGEKNDPSASGVGGSKSVDFANSNESTGSSYGSL